MVARSTPHTDPMMNDLGPLAWVAGEVTNSLEAVGKAIRRFAREVEAMQGKDLSLLDTNRLRLSKQQLRQVIGALEMVGLEKPAKLLHAMESAVERFIASPELCTEASANTFETAGFALTAYLENQLAGRALPALTLFLQYAEVQNLADKPRFHPVDLWEYKWQWQEIALPAEAGPAAELTLELRTQMEGQLLPLMRNSNTDAAEQLKHICASLSLAPQNTTQQSIFWALAAGLFDALAQPTLVIDSYLKRALTGILTQANVQLKDPSAANVRLAYELLFFNAQSQLSRQSPPPLTQTVLAAYGLAPEQACDYNKRVFGHYDPAMLKQARKRIAAVKETWSLITAGESNKYAMVQEQLQAIAESVAKLFPAGQDLSDALNTVADHIVRTAQPPTAATAMEVATSLLYIDAVLEDADLSHPELETRTQRLAERISNAEQGGTPPPLDPWMEELYRQVSDRQNMGSVVGELKVALNEIEQLMDQFFRNTAELAPLQDVPPKLGQMRGVLSILGLDDAIKAVQWMREHVEYLFIGQISTEEAQQSGIFEKLGTNLGVLGFLIDMLSYQPALTKKLFLFDAETKELQPLMGRAQAKSAAPNTNTHTRPAEAAEAALQDLDLDRPDFDLTHVPEDLIEPVVPPATTAAPVAAPATPSGAEAASPEPELDQELLGIFLEEAQDVVEQGLAAIASLRQTGTNPADLTTLRRSFHTLKGSSRMVGLHAFGEAAWSLEQVLNAWLADVKPAEESLMCFCSDALTQFRNWALQIGQTQQDAPYTSAAFAETARLFSETGTAPQLSFDAPAAPQQESLAEAEATTEEAFEVETNTAQAAADEAALSIAAHTDSPDAALSLDAPKPEPVATDEASLEVIDFDLPAVEETKVAEDPAAPVAEAQEPAEAFTLSFPDEDAAPAIEVIEAPAPALDISEAAEEVAEEEIPSFDIAESAPGAAPALEPSAADEVDTNQPYSEEALAFIAAFPTSDFQSLEPAPVAPEGEETLDLPYIDPSEFGPLDLGGNNTPAVYSDADAPPTPTTEDQAHDEVEPTAATSSAAPLESPAPSAAKEPETIEEAQEEEEDDYKVIGDLRISAPLYQVFLNEADDWSRLLLNALTDWSFNTEAPLPANTVAWAHSLAGSSATVGHTELSQLARLLEHCLARDLNEDNPARSRQMASRYLASAEEIRQLLHQFAAGILLTANGQIRADLEASLNDDFEEDGTPSARLDVEDLILASDQQKAQTSSASGDDSAFSPLAASPEAASQTNAVQDHIDLDLFPVFQEEAQELLPELASHLRQWQAAPHDAAARASILRVLHTFKGGARLAGAMQLGALAHDIETQIEMLGQEAPSTAEFDALLLQNDQLHEHFEQLEQQVLGAPEAPALAAQATAPALSEAQLPAIAAEVEAATDVTAEDAPPTAPADAAPVAQAAEAPEAIDALLFPIFEEEAQELLPQLGAHLRQWQAQPQDTQARAGVLRILHTLKGSARLAGAMQLGAMAHDMETHIEMLESEQGHSAAIADLLARHDALNESFEALAARINAAPEWPISPATAEPPAAPEAETETDASVPLAALPADEAASEEELPAQPTRISTLPPRTPYALRTLEASSQPVRVRSHALEQMLNLTGELSMSRAHLENELSLHLRAIHNDLENNLLRLRQQLRDIEVQSESQMQSRLELSKANAQSFDPLEFDRFTRVQELTRMMAESVNDVATVQRNIQRVVDATEGALSAQTRQTRELQRHLLRTRMVEFESISERLHRVVRQANKDTGKKVELHIIGGNIELDRSVLERITPAFEHLLRNAVAHGIEGGNTRLSKGKPEQGQIHIRVRQEGNDIAIAIEDDGRGLDTEKILATAVKKGLVPADAQLTEQEIFRLIYEPGFTTATTVTAVAGRGVGMDVVRSEVQALGCRIETDSTAGQGSCFTLVMPLTTAITQVVMVRAGAISFGLPASLVEIVRRLSKEELAQAYASGQLSHAGENIPLQWAGALLQSSPRSEEEIGRSASVIIVRSAAQRLALHIDEVLGNQEVVVKNLGPQLSKLPGLVAMSILPSGAIALIYNPVALHSVYRERSAAFIAQAQSAQANPNSSAQAPASSAIPLVMVVDDSITVRRVTQRMLQREGYRVLLANDGLMALEKLAEGQELPSIILSDIEMPRMDGFDLLRNLRNDARLNDIPIVMITSRIADKHREHAMSLGATYYLGKPYSEDELLGIIAQHTHAAEAQPLA